MKFTQQQLLQAARAAGRGRESFTCAELREQLGVTTKDRQKLNQFYRSFRTFQTAAGDELEKLGPNCYRLRVQEEERTIEVDVAELSEVGGITELATQPPPAAESVEQVAEATLESLEVVAESAQGDAESCETISADRLEAAGAEVKRLHFSRQQHNKVLIVRKQGKPIRVLAGSTNFSLRGLYIQANNVLSFSDRKTAERFGKVFDAYWAAPTKFRQDPLSQRWWVVRNQPKSRVSLCFSPHSDSALSLDPVAEAIEGAQDSVLYSVVFLSQITGKVRDALEELMQRSLFSYGVAQRTFALTVSKPDGSRGLLPFSYLAKNAPPPFKAEWSGDTTGHSNMVHHKFVVVDFNGERPMVFTGSSNMAQGGEKENGDHLICLEDRKLAIAYAIEALRMFDHFHFRVKAREAGAASELRLAKPPAPGGRTWFATYYRAGHVKERDRKLFAR